MSEKKTVRVLSIDGGGIRGIIPAKVLTALERMSGLPSADLFDVIAGTSTGGILALGLTMPGPDGRPAFKASDLVDLYVRNGPDIFKRGLWYRLRSLGGLLRPKFPGKNVERVLHEKFGAAEIKHALTEIMVTSYDLEHRKLQLFTRRKAQRSEDENFFVRDAARATSAAETYFPPAQITCVSGGREHVLVDGGTVANNPAALAMLGARDLYPDAEILLVALGTGRVEAPFPARRAVRWGLLGWATEIVDVLFDASANLTADAVKMEFATWKERSEENLYRFQTLLPPEHADMDDVSPANLAALEKIGEDLVNVGKAELEELCQRLPALAGEASPVH